MDTKIAVIGMGCRFPGGAHDPDAFWEILKNGTCTKEVVPGSRFNIEDYLYRGGDPTNKMMSSEGHFLTEGTCFDEAFFNLSPRQALNTDPQQRVLLETAVDALDDAGYRAVEEGGEPGWKPSRMGVFVASAVTNMASDIDTFYIPGVARGFLSGRLSHHFKWQGPSITYDAACASGLVALHAACQSLILRECDAAVTAGSNMITSPEFFIGLNKGFFVSNAGGCRTFDKTGDGYCRGECVAAFILKRLDDAIQQNDKIDAVIIASATNQSGPSESLTMPHAPTQAALFRSTCEKAGISPLAVRAVETHGTGTQAGDYAEMEAVKLAYTAGRPAVFDGDEGPTKATQLFVSAIKPNVGHSESSAGLASVVKAVLMMRHKAVPPHIGITTVRNPRLGDLEAAGIVIPNRLQPLTPVAGQEKIIISVNSFGAQGTNANVVLEESQYSGSRVGTDPRTYHVVALSGKKHTPFDLLTQRLLTHLETFPNIDLASLSYTTTARRVDYAARVAFSVSSVDELKEQLRKSPQPTIRGAKAAPKIGFVLGGNGSQFQGMGKTLYNTLPAFKRHIDHCNDALLAAGGSGLLGVVQGEVDPLAQTYEAMLASSSATVAVGYSLGKVWQQWGISPFVIIGHSLGEYAGLTLAGALTIEDAMKLVVAKCKAVFANPEAESRSGMLAMGCPVDRAQVLIAESGSTGLEIACFNGPSQTVVSGPREELVKLQTFVRALINPPPTKVLPGPFAWHSSYMSEAAAQVAAAGNDTTPTPAITPMVLNIDGSVLAPGDLIPRDYLANQLKMPVRWDLCASHAHCQTVDVWVELSAKAIMLPLVKAFVPAGKTFLPSINESSDSWSTISKALGRLYEAHAPLNWAEYHAEYPVRVVSLPSYPFARNQHYLPY
ncbi:thiolase-like protein, partial [Mycena albidolilacea]